MRSRGLGRVSRAPLTGRTECVAQLSVRAHWATPGGGSPPESSSSLNLVPGEEDSGQAASSSPWLDSTTRRSRRCASRPCPRRGIKCRHSPHPRGGSCAFLGGPRAWQMGAGSLQRLGALRGRLAGRRFACGRSALGWRRLLPRPPSQVGLVRRLAGSRSLGWVSRAPLAGRTECVAQ